MLTTSGRIACLVIITGIMSVAYSLISNEQEIDYITQVKPILNTKCISCHGGVKKQNGFSLLFKEEALAPTESGKPAIIPGDADGSEMIRRLTLTDPEERMPYKHEPLSKEEIGILRKWIDQGAKWGTHWAYLPVKPVDVPDEGEGWARNDIDRFIYERLEDLDLEPSQQADKATLLRRVSLDLIGMQPSEKLAKRYLTAADEEKAYAELVDSLLASPRFGEKWASMWLDLSRYADTRGYEKDANRNIWKYRDWVIKAFNQDKPYNRFITEQIAGDLLPHPTDDQYIATAFHRNTPSNDEAGTNNEEFRVAAVLDRVNTTWEGLMSTTFACVQCHSHPYDPFKHDEYYKFMAYFNNTRDEDVLGEYPLLRNYNGPLKKKLSSLNAWVKTVAPERSRSVDFFLRTGQPAINSTTADSLRNAVIGNHSIALYFRNSSGARLKNVDLEGSDQLIVRYRVRKPGGTMILRLDRPDGPEIARWKVDPTLKGQEAKAVDFAPQKGIRDVYLDYSNSRVTDPEEFIIYFNWFYFGKQFPGKGKPGYDKYKEIYWQLLNAPVTTTPILVENPAWMRRKSNVFKRGSWTSKGKEVQPGVPATLAYAMPAKAPRNRLGLAMWLTDKRNPLVSRTMANRLWEQLFGTGIVETLEDMGTQGLNPTHKELLDYLAYRFMNQDKWSVKALLKEMVTSATYRQDSKVSDNVKEKDPFNRYYARGPRVRLSAEQIRDQALNVCGLISKKMYGPGVMPWQPEGIWLSPYNRKDWKISNGEDRYRRAIYTYWKRTAPYPSIITFDGAERNLCSVRRIRTNTPLQALVTLNDSVYIDAARHFADKMKREGGPDLRSRISKGYEQLLYKPISGTRLSIFNGLYARVLADFKKHPESAIELMGNKKNARPDDAAMVVVANAMLNLDEVITKN